LLIASMYMVLGVWNSLFSGAFYAHERMDYDLLFHSVQCIITLIIGIPVIFLFENITYLFSVLLLARIIGLILAATIYRAKIHPSLKLRFDLQDLKADFRKGYPYATNSLLTFLYIQVDIFLLGLLRNDVEVGFYKAATSIPLQLPALIIAINTSFLPRMANTFITSPSKLRELISQSWKLALEISIPSALGLMLLAEPIMRSLYTESFVPAIVALQIIAIMIPLRFANNTLGTLLTAVGKQPKRTKAVFIGTLANILASVILIWKYGYFGASVATVLADTVIMVGLLHYSLNFIKLIKLVKLAFSPILAGMVMVCGLVVFQDQSLWLLIPIGMIIYLFISYITGGTFRTVLNFLITASKQQSNLA